MPDLFLVAPAQMRRIEPHFPSPHGVPRVDGRRVVSGIVFVVRNGLRCRGRADSSRTTANQGRRSGRQPGQRPKSDRLAPKVLALVAQGRSYRLVGREVGLSKNTVAGIVRRGRAGGTP